MVAANERCAGQWLPHTVCERGYRWCLKERNMFDDKQTVSKEHGIQDVTEHRQYTLTYGLARFVLLEGSAQK